MGSIFLFLAIKIRKEICFIYFNVTDLFQLLPTHSEIPDIFSEMFVYLEFSSLWVL